MDEELLAVFQDEAQEYIEEINDSLLVLESPKSEEDVNAQINSLFRALHSLKGASGMLGLVEINRVSHRAETILDRVRTGKLKLENEVLQCFFEVGDLLGKFVETISEPGAISEEVLETCLSRLEGLGMGDTMKDEPNRQSSQGEQNEIKRDSPSEPEKNKKPDKAQDDLLLAAIAAVDELTDEKDNVKQTGATGKIDPDEIFAKMEKGELDDKEALAAVQRVKVREKIEESRKGQQKDSAAEENEKPVSGVEMSKYFSVFIDEALDAVDIIEAHLIEMDETLRAGGAQDAEAINEIFRRAHQVKASSAAMGYHSLSGVLHQFETILDRVRQGEIKVNSELVQAFLQAIDVCKESLSQITKGQTEIEAGALVELLNCAVPPKTETPPQKKSESLPDAEKSVSEPEPEEKNAAKPLDELTKLNIIECLEKGLSVFDVSARVNRKELLPAMRVLMATERIDSLGEVLHCDPRSDVIEEVDDVNEFRIVIATDATYEQVLQAASADQIEDIKITAISEIVEELNNEKAPKSNVIQIHEEKNETPSPKTSSAADIEKHQIDKAELKSSSPRSSAKDDQTAEVEEGNRPKTIQTMRVDIERLEKLMNMSGELVISKAQFKSLETQIKDATDQRQLNSRLQSLIDSIKMIEKTGTSKNVSHDVVKGMCTQLTSLSQDLNGLLNELKESRRGKSLFTNFQEAVHQMDLISNSIQRAVMDIRMVPVGPLFGRFKRVVRDVCRDTGKKVELKFAGEDTEVDKKMIDELGDPLTHLVRNGVDHGIEVPEDREKNGKNSCGTLELRAFQKGNRICIVVKDDGGGINHEVLRKKAIEKEIFSKEIIDQMSEKDAIRLIFHPGFSTAQAVTNISGRGVGMDIVKQKIEELNGAIDIDTKVGEGTTFTISLPLTLATQKCLMCEVANTVFAIPLEAVSEIVNAKRDWLTTVQSDVFVRVRDRVIPVKTIAEVFPHSQFVEKVEHGQDLLENQSNHLVLIEGMLLNVALKVDRLLGEQDVVIKSLSRNFVEVDGIAGVSILGNGDVCLILDTEAIFGLLGKLGAITGEKLNLGLKEKIS